MAACDHAGCLGYCNHKACTPACQVCAVPAVESTSMFWRTRPRAPQNACPHCGAGAGEPCTSVGRHRHPLLDPHPSREVAA